MHGNLLETLVNRDVINEHTELTAKVIRKDVSGISFIKFDQTFYYVAHSLKNKETGEGSIIVQSDVDGVLDTIPIESVETIDGMEPRRLAGIYALDEEGVSVRQGARRGRKPKNREVA